VPSGSDSPGRGEAGESGQMTVYFGQGEAFPAKSASVMVMNVRGRVKWFDIGKGYGFVVADDEGGDILLHGNVLRAFGFTSVAEGAEIVVTVQSTERGRQATEVLDIVPAAEAASIAITPKGEPDAPLEPARVKWFDRGKGFGFVNIFGRPEDVFLHMEVLRQFGYGEVTAGDVLAVRVVEGPRGPMVFEVRSWDYVARRRALNGGSL
jgi:CspA family cold shock protein